jgi:5-methylcytosine-specific restriction endonuclease McrA
MDEATGTKVCTKCGERKALEEFRRDRQGRLGRRSECGACTRAQQFAKWIVKRDALRAERAAARAALAASAPRKTCRLCQQEKPLTEFYRLAKSEDGHQAVCGPCFLDRRRTQWGAAPEEKALRRAALAAKPAKYCARCGQEKPRDAFSKRTSCADGLAPWCKECTSAYSKEHYRANRAKRAAQAAAWRAANVEYMRELGRRWHRENPEQSARARAQWRAENPELMRTYSAKRRAKVKDVTIEPLIIEDLPRGSCGICLEPLDHNLRHPHPSSPSLDHILPIARGGAHAQWNLQWAHLSCNLRKGASIS